MLNLLLFCILTPICFFIVSVLNKIAVDFYNELSLMWGIICDVGIPPVDVGVGFPPGFQYFRSGDSGSGGGVGSIFKSSPSTSCSGPNYVEFVMNWVDREINNDVLFPTNSGEVNCSVCGRMLWN